MRPFFSGYARATRYLACNVRCQFVGSDGAITRRGAPITFTRAVRARPWPGGGQGGASTGQSVGSRLTSRQIEGGIEPDAAKSDQAQYGAKPSVFGLPIKQ